MVYFEDSVWSQMCDTPLSILRLTSRRRCNLSVQTDFSLRSVLFLGGIFASSFSAGAEGAFPASGKAHAIPLRSVLFFGYRGVASSFSAGAAREVSLSHCLHPPSLLCLCVISLPAHAIRWVEKCTTRTAAHKQRVPFDDDKKISSTGDDARATLRTRAFTLARSTAEQHQHTPLQWPACMCTSSTSLAFHPLSACKQQCTGARTSTPVERRPHAY